MALDTVTNIVPPILQSKRNVEPASIEEIKTKKSITDEMYMPEISTTPKAPSFEEVKKQYFEEITPALRGVEKAQREKDIFAAEQKQSELEGLIQKQTKIAQAYGKEKEAIEDSPEFAKLREVNDQLMNAEFIPTEDTAKDIAGLFSLIGVIGFAIGTGGKGNALNAMSAMNGMLKGYREGRADLYKRERETFDKNLQALKVKSDSLSQRLKQIAELAAIDTKAANAEADALFNQEQANFYKEYNEKFGLGATLKFAENNVEAVNKAFDYYSKILNASQKGQDKGNKPSAAQQKIYIDKNVIMKEFKELQSDLQNPRLRKLIDDNRVSSFFTEEGGKMASQLMQKQIPEELRRFLIKANKLRNSYYLDQSGKAVTGAEAMRNYGVVPNPGDTSQATAQKIDQMIEGLDTTIRGYQAFYGLPDISMEIQSGKILKAPTQRGENAFGTSGASYAIGQIIEKNGKKYRVVGGDMNDPDVEEVE